MLYHIEGIPDDMIDPTKGGVPLDEALKWARQWFAMKPLYYAYPLKLIDENGNRCDEQGNPLPP